MLSEPWSTGSDLTREIGRIIGSQGGRVDQGATLEFGKGQAFGDDVKSKYKAPMDQTAARVTGARMASHGIDRKRVAGMSVINND